MRGGPLKVLSYNVRYFGHRSGGITSQDSTVRRIAQALAHLDGGPPGGTAVVTHRLVGQFQIFLKRAMGPEAFALEDTVVGANCFNGGDASIGDEAGHLDKRELVFGIDDFAPEEGDPGAVLLRVMDEAEGVVGGAGAAAEDADHEVRVKMAPRLASAAPFLRLMVDHLE